MPNIRLATRIKKKGAVPFTKMSGSIPTRAPPAPEVTHCIIRVNDTSIHSGDMTRYDAIVMFNGIVEEPHKYATPGTIATFRLHRFRNGGYFQERVTQLFVK